MDVFTDRERIASTAGIETARQMALTAAVTIKMDEAGKIGCIVTYQASAENE